MAKILVTILVGLSTAAGLMSLTTHSAGAGPWGVPEGLRAALDDVAMVEQVRCRDSRGYRYVCSRGQRYGSIIIEPARAPRAYHVDYQAYAAAYGWGGY